jgi:hypothetical protein
MAHETRSRFPLKIEAAGQAGSAPRQTLGDLLCADTSCKNRVAPSPEQLAAAIEEDNAFSIALEARIGAAWRAYAKERFEEQATRIGRVESKLDANTAATTRVEESTAGIVDMMNSWAGAMKTIERIGKALKPLTWIVGFCTAVLGLWATLRAEWRA